MDICLEAEPKESPDGTKSNEDSGVETMEIDDLGGSATPTVERKEAEKRKRTSSRWLKLLAKIAIADVFFLQCKL